MLKNLSVLFVFISSTVKADFWSDDQLHEKPTFMQHLEGCFFKEIDNVIPYSGTVQFPGYCYVMQCTPDRIIYSACGIILTDDLNCDIKHIRFAATYPECCEEIRCLRDRISPKIVMRKGAFTSRNQRQKKRQRMHARYANYRQKYRLLLL